MKTTAIGVLKDKLYMAGIGLIVISLAFFCIPFFMQQREEFFGLFIPNYAIAIIYFIMLWASGRLRRGREGLQPFMLFLILFLISAYSLNRQMEVFEDSVAWFAVLLTIACFNYVATVFFESFHRTLQHMVVVLLGISWIAFLYLSFYLVPLYAPGAAVFFALGISLHTFVPALFCIYTIVLMRKLTRGRKQYWWSFGSGATAVVIFVIVFIIQWNHITSGINKSYRKATAKGSNGVPGWVAVAQNASHHWITEKALKTNLVYSVPGSNGESWLWRMPSRNFGEAKKHDPLVMTAAFFAGTPNISDDKRIKVLEAMYDSRHQAQERLWSGDDLFTEHINTAVGIWPQFGLSYTEKIITVTNAALQSGWGNLQQEAIYTFHLPEGAVITALSLWIEGKESKGMLTTKQKANTAYTTIVGREMRDPSVVHWQEGNTVSVRVFPVVAGESRLFKLGITAPLIRREGKLVYENIYFDGPGSANATEDIVLDLNQQPKDFVVPAAFSIKGKQSFKRSGHYEPSWNVQLGEQPLATDAFCFDGKIYNVRPYHKQRVATAVKDVYLDVNKAWSKSEFEYVYQLVADKQVYVYCDELLLLTRENKDQAFEALQKKQFSLFPIFSIQHTDHSLLISKSDGASPNISDLQDSPFLAELKKHMEQSKRIKLFNIGDHLSPYLKTLKEYRAFNYEHGRVEQLKELLTAGVFAQDIENDRQIVIDEADVAITQTDGSIPSVAPDHLMRLFSYNHIMQQMGSRLLTDSTVNDTLVSEAAKAYVVSPVSSLVVLESQKDYDRFDIKDSQNSLKNASLTSKGAVPEPHEWALIILALLIAFIVKYKPVIYKAG